MKVCDKRVDKFQIDISKGISSKVDVCETQSTRRKVNKVKPKTSNSHHSELVSTKEAFHELKAKWNTLLETSDCLNPFMTWEWMFTWWEIFEDKQHSLFIITIYKGDRLVSIAPFYIKERFPFIKRLGFIGEGEKRSDSIITHYPDIIVRNEDKEIAVTHIAKLLNNVIKNNKTFNYAKFDLIKNDAVIHDVTKVLTSCDSQKQFSGNQFKVELPESNDEYLASLSKSVKKQYKRKKKSLEKAGEVEIVTLDDLSQGLEVVEELHRSRWEDILSENTFDSKPFSTFHAKLSERLKDQDIMEIRAMKLNGKYIVASYNFSYKKEYFSYLGGFKNCDDFKRHSPMFTFDLLELNRLITEGYKSFDLLVSESESSYKKRFGSSETPCEKITWITKSPSAYLLKPAFTIKSLLSAIVEKLKGSWSKALSDS